MTAPEPSPWGNLPVGPGDVLAGKYRIDKVLGVGGMGAVVSATHIQLDQKVALKFMLPQGAQNQGLVERFSREARAAVRLKSDHVARVLDVGTLPWGAPYMVMEYLDGDDLGAIVERDGPMPPEMAVDCVLQACDAVAEAHSLGIVHRDLKPRNLFLTRRNDGRALVKVLDFGISKDKTGGDLSLTGTTEVIGSPYYMSPEQLKSSKSADERSDIWALGVILYELIIGRVPFLAESVTALTAMVLQENPIRVDQVRPGIPRELASAISRCLQKDPSLRFASVSELAAALHPFAPADSQELANRIARIGAGAGGPSMASLPLANSSAARIAVQGSTSVNWSERTKVATGSSKRAVWIAAAIGVVAVAGTAAGFVIAGRGPTATVPVASIPLPAASAVTPPVAASTTSPAVPSATDTASAAVASATASASATAPRGGAVAPVPGKPPGRGGAAPGSTDEPPKYRTNW